MAGTEERKRVISVGFRRVPLEERNGDTIYVSFNFGEEGSAEEELVKMNVESSEPFTFRTRRNSSPSFEGGREARYSLGNLKDKGWFEIYQGLVGDLAAQNAATLDLNRSLEEGLRFQKSFRDMVGECQRFGFLQQGY